jgi:hypothetical protein
MGIQKMHQNLSAGATSKVKPSDEIELRAFSQKNKRLPH